MPKLTKDVLVVGIFGVILAVISVVSIRALRESYDQNEKLRTVNRFIECLDPTTKCGKKLAEYQAAERKFLTETMKNQAVCTLLTSRTLRETDNMAELERVYSECVAARIEPPPEPPTSVVEEE